MKKNLLEINDAVEVKFDGGVEDGVLLEKGVFAGKVLLFADEGDELATVATIPYKDILGAVAQ